ncbi:MAG: prenyltransferase/squalene oxidase repeat-containing protein [Candidatus Heimdallarchaeota archaeon]
MNKKFLSNDFVQNNSIQGSTNLRFKVSYPPWTTWLNADNPYSYRTGTLQLIRYLSWISQFGVSSRNDVIDYNRINTTASEIKKIFTTSRIDDARLWTYCNSLIILKILDRLDEVDIAPMISYIQNQQLDDGGFHSHRSYTNPSLGNYSSLLMTYFSVLALNLVDAKPTNSSAVRDFVYRMQVNDSISAYSAWEFRMYSIEFASDRSYTNYALNILRLMGYDIPNKENLTMKVESEYQNIVANFSSWSNSEKKSELYFVSLRSVLLDQFNISKALAPIAWDFYQSFPDDHSYLLFRDDFNVDSSYLANTISMLGNASPELGFYISPGKFNGTKQTQYFTLKINNSAPFNYNFSLNNFLINSVQSDYSISFQGSGNYTLKSFESLEIPITLNKTINTTSSLDNLPLKLELTVPVIDLIKDSYHTKTFNSSIFFDLSKEQKLIIPTNTTTPDDNDGWSKLKLGLVIGLPILGTLLALIPVGIKYKRR